MRSIVKTLLVALSLPCPLVAASATGLPVDTANVITTHDGFVVPAGLAPHVAIIPDGRLQGVFDDGRLQGDRMSGRVGTGGSLEYESGRWNLSAGTFDWSILWGYSIQQIDGKPVFTLDLAWNYFVTQSNATVPVDYIDLGLTDVQFVEAFMNGQFSKSVFDAIAYATQIRRNAPEHKQYLLNLLVQMSYARYVSNYFAQYMMAYYRAIQMGMPAPTYDQLDFEDWWASSPQALVILYPTIFVEYVP